MCQRGHGRRVLSVSDVEYQSVVHRTVYTRRDFENAGLSVSDTEYQSIAHQTVNTRRDFENAMFECVPVEYSVSDSPYFQRKIMGCE